MNIVIGDQLINYEEAGSGKVIVFLHGWGADLTTFNDLATKLSTDFRVIRIDFPGFGKSPVPQNPWSVQEYVECVSAFLRKLKVAKPHALIGHSFGGRVIIKGLGTGRLTSGRVILIDAAGIKPKKTTKGKVIATIAKTGNSVAALPGLRRIKEPLAESFRRKFGSSDYQAAGELVEIFKRTIDEDLTEYLPAVTVPTLLLWGINDQDTPLSDARLMQKAIPHSTLEVYEDTGHFAYLDQPQRALNDIRKFLV